MNNEISIRGHRVCAVVFFDDGKVTQEVFQSEAVAEDNVKAWMFDIAFEQQNESLVRLLETNKVREASEKFREETGCWALVSSVSIY